MTDEQETKPVEQAHVVRGLRAMAIVRWVLLAFVAAAAAGTWWLYVVHPQDAALGPDRYHCPMHPEIRSPVPGTCPICFMKLEPIPQDRMEVQFPAEPGPPPAPEPGETPPGLTNVMVTLERRQAVGIATAEASRRSIARELRLAAVIEAPEKAVSEVRVRSPGFVERVAPVETGSRVKAGQPLLWIYSPELLRAQEELLTARRLRAAQPGAADHELSDRVAGAARERLLLLGAHVSDIDAVLERGQAERVVPIRAPQGGIVTARNVAVGTQATPDMMLFQVTDLSRVWASATVSPEDVGSIEVGTPGRFVSRAGQRSYDVEASLVEPRVSAETRTGIVRFTARNPDASLRPGDIGEVAVSLRAEEHVLVPRDAVVDVGATQYVFVEKAAGQFAPRVVQVGPLLGEERAIVRGLAPGERVVSRGAFVLDSESRLQAAVAPERKDAGAPAAPAPRPPSHDQHNHGGTP